MKKEPFFISIRPRRSHQNEQSDFHPLTGAPLKRKGLKFFSHQSGPSKTERQVGSFIFISIFIFIFISTTSLFAQQNCNANVDFHIVNQDETTTGIFGICGGPGNSGQGFTLLDNIPGQEAAAIWSNSMLDLNYAFSLDFSIRFTEEDPTVHQGADGLTFTMHKDIAGTAAVGGNGGYLGYSGIQPSVSIEFDIFSNSQLGDIGNDHSTVNYNGSFSPSNNPSYANLGEIENNAWYQVNISWDPCEENLCVAFDGNLLYCENRNIISEIFDGDGENVYWGFTAGKYSGASQHDICICNMTIGEACDNTIYDPCCPPITQESMWDYFTPTFSGGANGTYQMIFSEHQDFKDLMQAYTDFLALSCGADGLYFTWQLCDMGNGSQPGQGYCNTLLEQEFFHFIPGGNGVIQNNTYINTGFFNGLNSHLQPNHWYRITVGTYPNDELDCFDKDCSNTTLFDFRWQIGFRQRNVSGASPKSAELEILGLGSRKIEKPNH